MVFYTGVTNYLERRVWKHRKRKIELIQKENSDLKDMAVG